MSTKDTIMKLLADRGIKIYEESEFVKDSAREPIINKNEQVTSGHLACCAKEPDVGSQISIKMITQSLMETFLLQKTDIGIYAWGETWQRFERECFISKQGEEHPNIQNCLGVMKRVEKDMLPFLVFKDVAIGSLQTFVSEDERATNKTKMELMRDVANGLAFLHERRILHRDLRCRNILVDVRDGKLTALLSGFGSGENFQAVKLLPVGKSLFLMSLLWMAPEYLQNDDQAYEFDNGAGDMWAFGCTMVEVLAGIEIIWPSTYGEEDIKKALESGERPPRPATFPPWDEAWNFIHDRCWNLDPKKRITSREAVVELEALLKTVPPSV